MGVDKFIQPIEGIEVEHVPGPAGLISPDIVKKYADRIRAGENRDKVITEFAQEIVEFEDELRAEGLLPELELPESMSTSPKYAAAKEGPLHATADAHESFFAVAITTAFAKARKVIKQNPLKIDDAIEVMRSSLKETLPNTLKQVMSAGGNTALSTIRTAEEFRTARRRVPKLEFKFDVENQAAIDWADKHAGELIDGITEESREAISNAIAELLETGDWKEAVDEIASVIGDEERARKIARHETMLAVSEGQRQMWKQAINAGELDDDTARSWITVGDNKVCPQCENLDGATAKVGKNYPGGISGPPAHVGCRCTEGLS